MAGTTRTSANYEIRPSSAGLLDATLQLGETAEESAAVWTALPPLRWIYEPLHTKRGVQVLARAATGQGDATSRPAIMRHYVGAGEVWLHATDETWRWRWRNDERFFARYWGQVIRRMARGRATRDQGALWTNRKEYAPGEPVMIRLRRGAAGDRTEDAPVVELAGRSTPTREVRLARIGSLAQTFQATLQELKPDRYTARAPSSNGRTPLTTEFSVAAPPAERSQLATNTAGLRAIAERTGGKFYTISTVDRLPHELPRARPTIVETLPPEPICNASWLLTALCMALGTEWLMRRRWGLL